MNDSQFETIQAISNSYLNNFKPLLHALKTRKNGTFPKNCLNEIRAINDHIARCYREGISSEDITKEIGKAEGHLQRLAYDCYKQLILYQVADIKHTIKWYYSSRWLKIGNGDLWVKYIENYKHARKAEFDAKYNESISSDNALAAYDAAYGYYQEILEAFKKYKRKIRVYALVGFLERATKFTWWLIGTIILSIITTILAWLDIFSI